MLQDCNIFFPETIMYQIYISITNTQKKSNAWMNQQITIDKVCFKDNKQFQIK